MLLGHSSDEKFLFVLVSVVAVILESNRRNS